MKKARVFWIALAMLGVVFLLLLTRLLLVMRMRPLTPKDVEAILVGEPATPEELFQALRQHKWSDSLHIGDNTKGYVAYNMKNATEMWGNYFKEHPERSAEITWYERSNLEPGTRRTVSDVRFMCEVSANTIQDYYHTDRPPVVYLILLSSENEIVGWVRFRGLSH